jgi:NlpE N-terminal domain
MSVSAFGQTMNNVQQKTGEAGIIKDSFKGIIPEAKQDISIHLILKHLLYADDGDFTLNESFIGPDRKEHAINSFGEWTVLKGDAKDENATVVELDAPDNILYFLRLKDGNLQMLDTSLREIKPAAKYMLHKDSD